MTKERMLGVGELVLAVVAILLTILLVSDDQAANIVGLTKSDVQNSAMLLSRLGIVLRLGIVALVVLIFLILFLITMRAFRDSQPVPVASHLVTNDVGVGEVIDYLASHPEAHTLRVWGYSLNWASDLTLFLADNRRSKLAVALFVPLTDSVGVRFNDTCGDERKAMLRLRTSEWKELQARGMVASTRIYWAAAVPNGHGSDDR